MSPLLAWEGPADQMPDFCPNGCGGVTEDPYGGPCKACWDAIGKRDATAGGEHCNWCQRGGEMLSYGGLLFCGDECAADYYREWGDGG